MIESVELIHLMDNSFRMIQDSVYDSFYLAGHFYYHNCPQCGSFLIQLQLMKNLMMIWLVELNHLIGDLYKMIQDGFYNSLHLTIIFLF